MSYPIDTIEGLGAVDGSLWDLIPGVFLARRLLQSSPEGGTMVGRTALSTFHFTMGPSPWTPVVAGAVLGSLVIGAAVVIRKQGK